MRKEVLLAIIIGVGVGLVLTFGIWTANQALKEKGGGKVAVSPTPTVGGKLENEAKEEGLAILSPEEGDLFDKDTILIKGTAWAGADVVVLAGRQEVAVKASETGEFEVTVKLTAGENVLRVIAFNVEGDKRVEKVVTVVFSSQFE